MAGKGRSHGDGMGKDGIGWDGEGWGGMGSGWKWMLSFLMTWISVHREEERDDCVCVGAFQDRLTQRENTSQERCG